MNLPAAGVKYPLLSVVAGYSSLTQAWPVNEAIKEVVDSVLKVIQDSTIYFASRLLELVITIARAFYLVVGLIGLFLWASHISPYRGRGMVLGALLMAIVAEVAARILL
ncbi:MAG: hypothetical protein DRJ97_04775 [Thermoprotei archaeon]|nr:MAG: hypothetical protein DRJ97_04775 [Thermoprotei archaeon]